MPRVQEAYAVVTNAYIGLHQVTHELWHGSVNEAKNLLARQIAGESECADGAVGLWGRLRGFREV